MNQADITVAQFPSDHVKSLDISFPLIILPSGLASHPPGDSYQGGGCLQYPVHVGQAGVVARLTASPLTAEVTIQTYNQHSSSLRHFLFNSDCYDTTRTFTRRLGHFLIQNFLAPDCWSDLDEQCDVPIGRLLSIFDQCTTTTNLSSSHWGMFLLLYN